MVAAGQGEKTDRYVKELAEAGYSVVTAYDQTEVLTLLESGGAELLLIDSGLPGMNDFDLVRRLEARAEQLPVVVIGHDGADEAVHALEAGANDYIPDHGDKREFLARVANVFKLFYARQKEQERTIQIGDLRIDPSSREVVRSGELIHLTQREYKLLLYLAKRANQVCTREEILKHVWDFDFHTGTNVVDVYILHLREKLDKGHKTKLLSTVRGAGYMLKTPLPSDAQAGT
ncbi:DNA-binding response regulator [Paenibacillus sp. 7541]|uniref:Response regulator n=2 Tax=Paenibacillus TaxID=44249 RepID=A0A268F1W3_9BACL|nr:response regulator [Paenibacillus campinasensis]PAD79362.1 DNA-binding response regulator [Paenibacillus campinasensis]PAK51695.1 DNA-binding response regulator [Paenibacillus sp. 7541]